MKTIKTKRVCRMCDKKRDVKFFSKRPNYHGTSTQYYVSYCKDCMKERAKDWVKKNTLRFKVYQANYQKEHYRKNKKKNDSSKRKFR